jgi:hypothetical protein
MSATEAESRQCFNQNEKYTESNLSFAEEKGAKHKLKAGIRE